MITKRRKEQLESLLEWEGEGRLPDTVELFNRLISKTLSLKEIGLRIWEIEILEEKEGKIRRNNILIKHETLIQLGLTILDAIKITEDRWVNKKEK